MTDADYNLIQHIKCGQKDALPTLSDMQQVARVRDRAVVWEVYISHDPCHDRKGFRDDRNTVIAFNNRGQWRIIGRELHYQLAMDIATGERPVVKENENAIRAQRGDVFACVYGLAKNKIYRVEIVRVTKTLAIDTIGRRWRLKDGGLVGHEVSATSSYHAITRWTRKHTLMLNRAKKKVRHSGQA